MGWGIVAGLTAIRPLLVAWMVSGHVDGLALANAAKTFDVPPALMWSVAYQETRHSWRNTEVSTAGAWGRMQIMPLYWAKQCGYVLGRRHYERNIHCGALILRFYLSQCSEDATCAAFRYVGGDSSYAREVGFRALNMKAKAVWAVAPEESVSSP